MTETPPAHRSMAHMVRHWRAIRPDAPALTVGERGTLDYRELDDRTSRVANGLRARGIGAGDTIAFLGVDTRTWAATLVGASKVRAAGTPLNWRLSRDEVEVVLRDADASAIVVESEFLPLLGRDPSDAGPGDGPVIVFGDEILPFDAWIDAQSADDPDDDLPRPDDVAFVFYTSGTTGVPKGVELTNSSITANLAKPTPWTIEPGDVVFVPAPTFHLTGSGWLFATLAAGGHALYVPQIRPELVLRLFAEYAVTIALTVPAILQMLVRHPMAATVDFGALRTVVYGGSPISPTLLREVRDAFGCDLCQAYGMTESNGPLTFLRPDDHRVDAPEHRLTSAGRPVEGIEVEIHDPVDGARVGVGVVGEVWTRSDQLMRGYRHRPDETRAALTDDGWLRTGDAGYLDDDGFLFLTDRVKDMIVSGGENIYPIEIENVLTGHPGVADAAVIGVPHEKWGETVKAVVVPRPGVELDVDELIDYCRAAIAHYKCPTSIDLIDELPRNPSGKILKRSLREPYWTDAARQVG